MEKFALFIFLITFLSLTTAVNATVFASDSSGNEKNVFYSNETVYINANESVASGSASVRVYVVANNDSWDNGTILTAVIPYITVSTNSNGNLALTLVWSPDTTAGSYDLVVDANNDGVYNKSIDFVDNETALGFQILTAPKPTLTFALGEKNPANHNWNSTNGSQDVMVQLKITASAQDIILSSMDLIASGSGDDQRGISTIRVLADSNSNGDIDDADNLIAFGKFLVDNGVYGASIQNGYTIKENKAVYLIVTYSMSSSVVDNETFNFQVISASAVGVAGTKAVITGLPLVSSTKTIIGPKVAEEKTDNTTCSEYINQSSCSGGCKWCANDNSCRNEDDACPTLCNGTLSLSVEQNTASISGLNNCENKTLYIKEDGCNNETIVSCNVTGSGCSANLPFPSEGNHTYYACIDFNDDSTFESSEQTSEIISIQQQVQQQPASVEKPSEFNYLYLIIPVAMVLIVAAYLLRFRKKSNEYEKLKEKWR
ncbi:MAG: hypothetical protein HY361_03005 [Candidatus Aenigmarchaeota archaeon]|nr:hypothetical protein [Candidatus Aenigmarchaeota archaeon]